MIERHPGPIGSSPQMIDTEFIIANNQKLDRPTYIFYQVSASTANRNTSYQYQQTPELPHTILESQKTPFVYLFESGEVYREDSGVHRLKSSQQPSCQRTGGISARNGCAEEEHEDSTYFC